jgi:hypothetical protein
MNDVLYSRAPADIEVIDGDDSIEDILREEFDWHDPNRLGYFLGQN